MRNEGGEVCLENKKEGGEVCLENKKEGGEVCLKNNNSENEINSDLIAKELYSVYQKCIQAVPVMVKDKETGKQVPSGIYQFDARCALKALQLLGDALGTFKEKSSTDEASALSYEDIIKNGGFEYEF